MTLKSFEFRSRPTPTPNAKREKKATSEWIPARTFYVGENVAKDKHLSEIVYIKYEGPEQSMRLTSLHIGFGDRPMLKERK